jgi:hypothetical protein
MDQTVKALSELTGAPPWPDRWLSLPEFAAELGRAGFWGRAGRGSLTEQGKRDFLAGALRALDEEGLPVWADLGGRYKHDALLTPDDFCALLRWHDAAARARGATCTLRAPPAPG